MNEQNTKIANMYNLTEKIEKLEKDMLSIPHVTDIDFDLNGFLDNMHQVIIIIGYKYSNADMSSYATQIRNLKTNIINTAKKHGLTRTEDTLEDYGTHLYIVFNHDNTWLK